MLWRMHNKNRLSPENFFDEGETFGFFHTKLQQMSVITQ